MKIGSRLEKLEESYLKNHKRNYESFTIKEYDGKKYLIEHRFNGTLEKFPEKTEWIEPPRIPFTSRVIVIFHPPNERPVTKL